MTASTSQTAVYSFYQIAEAATGNTLSSGQLSWTSAGTEDAYFWGMQTNNGYLLDYVSSQAHNLILQSADVTTSWTNVGSTDSGNTDTGPDGTTTADRVIEDSTAASRHILYQIINAPSGLTTTFTTRLKQGTRRYAQVFLSDNNSVFYGVTFDLSNGDVGEIRTATSPTNTNYTIKLIANGFYEISVTMTLTHATNYAGVALSDALTPASYSSNNPSYNGDGASYVIVGPQQYELASSPGKYVATTTAAVYNPHFDIPIEYNTDGTVKSLTREEQRTNSFVYTTFGSGWAYQLTSNQTTGQTGIDGAATAVLVEHGANYLSAVSQSVTTLTGTDNYCVSYYAKTVSGAGKASCVMYNATDGEVDGTVFDINDTEWTLVYHVFSPTVTTSGFYLANGDNTARNVYISDPQCEKGSTPSSRIRTGSAAVTRAADVVTWSTKIMPSISTALSAYIYTTPDALSAGNKQLIDIYDSAKSDRIQMYYASTSTANTFTDGGVLQASLSGTMAAVHKGAFAAQANSFTVYENGSIAGGGEDTSGTMPDCSNGVHLGTNYLGSAVYGGKVHEILIVPSKLSAAQLDAITTA